MIVLACMIAFFFSWGVFLLLEEILNIPSYRSRAAMTRLWKSRRGESFIHSLVGKMSARIVSRIHLREGWRENLAASLKLAGQTESPEEYVAGCAARGFLLSLGLLPLAIVNPWILLASPVLGFLSFVFFYRKVERTAEERRKLIEKELFGFVIYLRQRVHREPSVLRLISGYRENAGEPFRSELERTVAELSSGNEEVALLHLERRIHSPKISMVVRGLMGVSRGENMDLFWQNVSAKMEEEQKQLLKKEAAKFPKSVRKYSLLLLGCFLLTYLVVIGEEIFVSLGGMI